MHVLSVVCHPRSDSFTHAVLERFAAGAKAAGHTHEVADLYREGFDPVMTERDLQQFNGVPMPAAIVQEQGRIERAEALCLIFPLWWFGMPAMMKGWLDRVWSAGWAYAWQHDPKGSLLEPRPCTLLVPTGASEKMAAEWGCPEDVERVWRIGVFGYCGVEPLKIHLLLDAAFESGVHGPHLETAYEAGLSIGVV